VLLVLASYVFSASLSLLVSLIFDVAAVFGAPGFLPVNDVLVVSAFSAC
jgi:hypothetical protein